MASISARGACKLAQANREWTDDDGYKHKSRLALRSDGAILVAHDLLTPELAGYGSRGWSRGGYSIALRIAKGANQRTEFLAFAQRHGHTLV